MVYPRPNAVPSGFLQRLVFSVHFRFKFLIKRPKYQ